jgi:hypothetical protein
LDGILLSLFEQGAWFWLWFNLNRHRCWWNKIMRFGQYGAINLIKRMNDVEIIRVVLFSINAGSISNFYSILYDKCGASFAFGLQRLLALATLIFWLGRKKYIIVPPSGIEFNQQNSKKD